MPSIQQIITRRAKIQNKQMNMVRGNKKGIRTRLRDGRDLELPDGI